MQHIPVGDFKLGKKEKKAINEVLDLGRISEWRKVKEFEQKWAKFIGTKYCVATSSGSGALITGLTALKYYKKLSPGAKVITTPLTYIADSSAISVTGFEPIYVDVDMKTFGITPENIKNHFKKANKIKDYAIILPVNLMGFPVEIDKINDIAKEYNLLVLEDSAQSHGTIYDGKRSGSQTLLSIFSFYIAHNIQAGEMGALVTSDPEIFRLSRKIKAQGRACDCLICTRNQGVCPYLMKHRKKGDFDPRFVHDLIGYNFKTMEFQAVLALSQLEKAQQIIKKRQANVKYLNDRLKRYSQVLQLPPYSKEVSYLAYPLVIKNPKFITRKKLRQELEKLGVETRPLFGCIPTQQPSYSHLKNKYRGRLANAEYLGLNGFYIGCHQYLNNYNLEYIVSVFKRILK